MKKERLLEILEKFNSIRIAVVGDMMLDDYIIGTVDRISPEAPVPVVRVREERFVLGGAANVVNNLSTLGAQTLS
ncbi:MAG: D-glycero-beta-D-manno-heptose-7-phosphate kinase, partial [Fusobacteriaceae bacterium]